jgi:hypothetical protein
VAFVLELMMVWRNCFKLQDNEEISDL